MKYIRTNPARIDYWIHETDLADPKGRAIGYRVTITHEDVREAAESAMAWHGASDPYRIQIHQLRNGVQFGAIQRSQFARTEDDARALAVFTVARRVKAAAKKSRQMSWPRTTKQLRERAEVRMVYYEGPTDGWWCELNDGWQWQGVHSVHEDTVGDMLQTFREIEPCDCEQCIATGSRRTGETTTPKN